MDLFVVIFSYNRPEMLVKVFNQFIEEGISFHIIDDGSGFKIDHRLPHTRFQNGGKKEFWKKFKYGFELMRKSGKGNWLFMPDDFLDLDIEVIKKIVEEWSGKNYVLNLINDGRDHCWGYHRIGMRDIEVLDNVIKEVGFCDCGFLTTREAMEGIDVEKVPDSWFDHPDKSSGVGMQLTRKMRKMGIPMFKPMKSLAYHGDHESVMHGDHRKDVKLKSK